MGFHSMDRKELQADLFLLGTAVIWGIAFVEQRIATNYVGPLFFNGVRFALGAISIMPFAFLYGKHLKSEENSTKYPSWKQTLPLGIILGVVLFGAASLQQVGLESTTAGKAGFITDLYIVFVPLGEILFGQKPKKTIWISVTLSLIGLYFISVNESFSISKGDFVVFISSIVWAIQILILDRYSKRYNPMTLSLIQYIANSLLNLIAALLFEKISFAALFGIWPIVLYTGVISVGVAYTFQILGQRHAKASHTALILSTDAIFASVAGMIILHEGMNGRGIIGSAIVICAVILSQLSFGRVSPQGKT